MNSQRLKEFIDTELHVGIQSTCSGAWPVIYRKWTDPERNNEVWCEEVAQTPSAFEQAYDSQEKAVTYNEEPHSFKECTNARDSLEMAYAIAALPKLLKLARFVAANPNITNPTAKKLATAALDALCVPDPIPHEDPEVQ